MPRRFRACEGRTVMLPQGLYAGPGQTNMRLDPGAVITLEDDNLIRHERYINGRVRAGDLEEVEEHVVSTVEPVAVRPPDSSRPMRFDIHAPPEKLARPKKDGE